MAHARRAGLLIPMTMFQFGRAFETEADLLGLEYLYKAGYDPNGMVDMFEKIESPQTGSVRASWRGYFQPIRPRATGSSRSRRIFRSCSKPQPQYVV